MFSKRIWAFIIVLCLFPVFTLKAASLDIIINEVAWMGTKTSANDEWIELYNNNTSPINLDGWVLKSADGTPEIKLTGTIPANGYFLLERTDDNTVPEVTADLIYKGALGNNGEDLKLYDSDGNLIGEVNCSSGWFAGDNATKQTMERTGQNWQTGQSPGGTPKAENSLGAIANAPAPSPILTPTPPTTTLVTPSPTPAPTTQATPEIKNYPLGIVFSELLPSPEGPDETEKWVEIQNQNNFEVDLSGWQIKDTKGKISTYIFPNGTKIAALGYIILPRTETKITLNNDGDGLNILNPNKESIDSVSFEKTPLGQSYTKIKNTWLWSSVLTPGKENIAPAIQEESPQDKKSPNEPASSKSPLAKETAAIGKALSAQKDNKLLFVFLIAFIVAIF